jgi:hypothetical protein
MRLTPEQEAAYALDYDLPRDSLKPAVQVEYGGHRAALCSHIGEADRDDVTQVMHQALAQAKTWASGHALRAASRPLLEKRTCGCAGGPPSPGLPQSRVSPGTVSPACRASGTRPTDHAPNRQS